MRTVRVAPLGSTTPLAPPLRVVVERLARMPERSARARYALDVLDLVFADHAARRRLLTTDEFERAMSLKKAAAALATKGAPK